MHKNLVHSPNSPFIPPPPFPSFSTDSPCYDWTVPVLARIDVVLVRVLLVLLRGVAVVAIDIDVPCFSSSGLNGLESLWVEEEQPMALRFFRTTLSNDCGDAAPFSDFAKKQPRAKKVGFRPWTVELHFGLGRYLSYTNRLLKVKPLDSIQIIPHHSFLPKPHQIPMKKKTSQIHQNIGAWSPQDWSAKMMNSGQPDMFHALGIESEPRFEQCIQDSQLPSILL